MTLVGAMRLPDRFLFGVDGRLIVDNEVLIPADKSFEVPWCTSIRWAYAGAMSVGVAFRTWLDAQSFSDWDELVKACVRELAALNGDSVRMAEDSCATPEPAEVLIVGFLKGEGRIMYFDSDGGPTNWPESVIFLGGGGPLAWIGWDVALRVTEDGQAVSRDTFEAVMAAVIESTPLLGSPPQIHEVLP